LWSVSSVRFRLWRSEPRSCSVHRDAYRLDRVVPFSCTRRRFCHSCGSRSMADTAAHLVDRVFPQIPVRQWVLLSFPHVPWPSS
jgi:hypothetical protein